LKETISSSMASVEFLGAVLGVATSLKGFDLVLHTFPQMPDQGRCCLIQGHEYFIFECFLVFSDVRRSWRCVSLTSGGVGAGVNSTIAMFSHHLSFLTLHITHVSYILIPSSHHPHTPYFLFHMQSGSHSSSHSRTVCPSYCTKCT